MTVATAKRSRTGQRVRVAGLVIRPHRPPTKSGKTVVFFTLEDETGLLDATMFERVYHRCGAAVFTQPVVTLGGRLDWRGSAAAPAALVVEEVESWEMAPTADFADCADSCVGTWVPTQRTTIAPRTLRQALAPTNGRDDSIFAG